MSDDRHPEELLAGYVDGTLNDRERAVVEAHLSTCDRCREESALAMRALGVLREIQEDPVPFGVMNPVTAEIGRRMSRSARPLSQRVLWAAGGAIAAAFVGIVAVWLLPSVGGGNDAADTAGGAVEANAPQATTAGGGGSTFEGASVALERRSTDFDDAALERLAKQTAAEVRSGSQRAATGDGSEAGATQAALACVAQGAGGEPHEVLVRLIQARYKGDPAYVAVYLTSPAPGQPPKSVLVWVVHTDTCQVANFTQWRS